MLSLRRTDDELPPRLFRARFPAGGGLLIATLAVLPASGQGSTEEPSRILVVPVRRAVDGEEASRIRQRTRTELSREAAYRTVIVEIDAAGGSAKACEELATYFQQEVPAGEGRRTVAWIPDRIDPLGPVFLLVAACRDVVLGPDATLAALGGEPPRAPDWGDPFRRKLERFTEANGRPSLLARAAIDPDRDDILSVVLQRHADTIALVHPWDEGELINSFMTRGDYQNLAPAVKRKELAERRTVVVPAGRVLSLDARRAKRFRMADAIAADLHELRLQLALDADDASVVILDRGPLEARYPAGQAVIDFFNHPVARFFLVLGGCLGLLLELKMLGMMLPGVCGLACFVVLFTTSLFPVTGTTVPTATLFEITLFALGLGFIALELFLVPGVAIFALAGGTLCAVSLVLSMVPPETASAAGDHMSVKQAITLLVFSLGSGALLFAGLLAVLPRSSLASQKGIISYVAIEGVSTADSALEAQIAGADLVGRAGVTDTVLRPSGRVILDDGRELDVVSEGGLIERGVRVVVTSRSGTRLTVAPIPPEGSGGEGRDVESPE